MIERLISDATPKAQDLQVSAPVQPEPEQEFKIPKTEFRQGIFDPAIANAAQAMFTQKKQGSIPPTGAGMSPPGFSNSTPRGGRPGGA